MKHVLQFIIPLLLFGKVAFAQTNLTGSVKDRQSSPLPGAVVSIIGSNINSVADANGQFSIAAPSQLPFTIRVSFVGYKNHEIQVYELPENPINVVLVEANRLDEVVVTSRRREEVGQAVPIPISVISGARIEQSGAFNVNRLKEFVPSLQLYSSNPRNTGINIRGLGSPFGLTNDGLDPGVGFYVDGVYYARPAATTLDFIDIDQVEVLRGPQGTLFGKNTTAGALNITTRKPSFTSGANFEVSYGNYQYVQAKASVTGPLTKKIAARVSFSGTQRDGLIFNNRTQHYTNTLNNLGGRVQFLYQPSEKVNITLAADVTRQRPDGYAQVIAGVVTTKRPAYRQFNKIINDLNYQLPSQNAFERVIDTDTPWKSGSDLGGASLTANFKIGPGTLTSTTAWRYWLWDPSSDRDFTGLQALAKSANYSKQDNWSQEVRYAGELSSKLSGVVGLFALGQQVQSDPYNIEESGNATWRFSQSDTSSLWKTPGLFEGFGIRTKNSIKSLSAAAFANVDWEIVKGLHFQPGIRFNYDSKDVFYDRQTYGGLDVANSGYSAAVKKKLQGYKDIVYANQAYATNTNETHFTYNATLAYRPNERINGYATYSTAFKPVGVNVNGLPTVNGQAATDLAVIKPEDVKHVEVGIKTSPFNWATVNLTFYNTDIANYQTSVQSPELGVNRGYIANAEKVKVQGAELDANIKAGQYFSLYGSLAYTDGKYVTFTNAPLPLEETGTTVVDNGVSKQLAFKDISGSRLPGISNWASSAGAEFAAPVNFLRQSGKFFIAFDTYYRSEFSSSPTPSKYLNIDDYFLLNTRFGFRSPTGTSITIWSRNLLNQNYYEQLLVAGGNAGQYAGVLGDQRTFGITIKQSF